MALSLTTSRSFPAVHEASQRLAIGVEAEVRRLRGDARRVHEGEKGIVGVLAAFESFGYKAVREREGLCRPRRGTAR
jgi:hypothetical protein